MLISASVRQRTDERGRLLQSRPTRKRANPACFTSVTHHRKRLTINITLHLIPIVSLIAGILILIMPRLLSTIVAIYLIMVGLVGLFGTGNLLR